MKRLTAYTVLLAAAVACVAFAASAATAKPQTAYTTMIIVGHVLGLLGVRVTPVAISRWVADGRLAYRGVDTSGRRLLRLGDIADLASAHAAKAGR